MLTNWKQAQKALEDTQHAQDSAIKENERYMQSIQGHISLLQNELQKLAAISIDSDWIKNIVDIGTGAVKIITTLVDKIGAIPALIGSVGGAILALSGKGLFGGTGVINEKGVGGFVRGIGSAIQQLITTKTLPETSIFEASKDPMIQALSKFDPT